MLCLRIIEMLKIQIFPQKAARRFFREIRDGLKPLLELVPAERLELPTH